MDAAEYNAERRRNSPGQMGRNSRERGFNNVDPVHDVEEKAEERIRQAELLKAKMFDVAGKSKKCTAEIDEGIMLIGSLLDEVLIQKIKDGRYVDSAKLVLKDKVAEEDNNRLELVHKPGKGTFYVPASNRELSNISNIGKWDQAFRIYLKVYSSYHPNRAAELVEYSHVIHGAAGIFIWQNVYNYDKHFRIHMGNNPTRNWGIILQQAWSFYLTDKISTSVNPISQFSPASQKKSEGPRKEWENMS